MTASLEPGWLAVLQKEFEKDYMLQLKAFLQAEKNSDKKIFPKNSEIFSALNSTAFEKVKVIILGQDPYHGAGQAHGLSFSVKKGVATPPSLKNIYKELHSDLGNFIAPNHGHLQQWAEQGVLLLNATLTVRASEPGSHQKYGWETFTDTIIKNLSDKKEHLVFLLWGNYAKQKAALIDQTKHLIISSAHPSPFSAYNGFFGSKPFSKTNNWLVEHGLAAINWHLED
ncbi:uracil-DNA glycosylase [Pedobacter sp. UYP30]|uniref:uracil-DNA glycosylase n=1 Tax=Pedobacter sp. UYP30 TaxID=1756400 RepID=UPI003396E48F